MHYIRCPRPPKILVNGPSSSVEVLFTITTDLGDSFLYPEEPIELAVAVDVLSAENGVESVPLSGLGELTWQPGQRVTKHNFPLPPIVAQAVAASLQVQLTISADYEISADSLSTILAESENGNEAQGLIMPVSLMLSPLGSEDRQVSTRSLVFGDEASGEECMVIDIEEEIGESIARHIWDAGVLSLCAFASTVFLPSSTTSQGPCMSMISTVLRSSPSLSILELGCGVGILGGGLASLSSKVRENASTDSFVLLTDLEEAENQARTNLAHLSDGASARLGYENLDWEEGRQGRFGPRTSGNRWDLIILSDCTYNVDMLPALVETLSALHYSNASKQDAGNGGWVTKVFLATKPRHSSERVLFDLLTQHDWTRVAEQRLPLPVLGAEPESVELYLLEKR